MATTVEQVYANAIAVPITLDGLASGSYRQSAAIDNTSKLYVGATVGMTIVTPTSGTLSATSPSSSLWVVGTIDGFTYTDGASGSDSAFTAPGQLNAPPLLICGVGTASQALSAAVKGIAGPVSVGIPFGQDIPRMFGFYVQNNLGVAHAAAPSALTISAVTNTTNPTITTTTAHGLYAGQVVDITSVLGATGIDGWWVVQSVPLTTTFTIAAPAPGVYTSGGSVQPQLSSVVLLPNQYQAV